MPLISSYKAFAVDVSGSTATVASSTPLATGGIHDNTPGNADNGILGSASGVTSTFAFGGNTWDYIGTVTINGINGFLATYNGQTAFFELSPYTNPPVNSTGTVLPASGSSGQGDRDWNTFKGAQDVACFTAGTMIATPDGEVAVEALKSGDLVLTESGAAVPVRWVGRSMTARMFADPVRVLPIQIKAGALAENMPVRDLFVSSGHALKLDGVLVHAGALVNGMSIVRDTTAPLVFDYYHVELDRHDVMIADGVPAESYVDGIEDYKFDNIADRPALDAPVAEMDLPRAKSARQVPQSIRAMIAARVPFVAPEVDIAA